MQVELFPWFNAENNKTIKENMMKNTLAIIAAVSLLASGCATDNTKPTQDNLQPSQLTNSIILSDNLTINEFEGGRNGLISGVYAPVAESADGIFYDGPSDCVWEELQNKKTKYDGGIWWPKSPKNKPRMYWRLSEKQIVRDERGVPIGGFITSLIIRSGFGHANFFPEITKSELLIKLTPVNKESHPQDQSSL